MIHNKIKIQRRLIGQHFSMMALSLLVKFKLIDFGKNEDVEGEF